jgi:TolA-binding protein
VGRAQPQVILVVVCVLAVGVGCTFSWQSPRATGATAIRVVSVSPSPSPLATDHASQTTLSPPGDVAQELQRLEDEISRLRGLKPAAQTRVELMSPDELRAMALEACEAQGTNGALRPETLSMLGLVRGNLDIDTVYAAHAADWASALTSLYDESSRSIALLNLSALDPASRLDYLTAYLAALRGGIREASRPGACCPIGCALAGDADLAAEALLLGDTRLALEQWVRIYGDQDDAAHFGSLIDPTDETRSLLAPYFLEDTYGFVLSGGRAFVQGLFLSGGWPAVDEAYADPPISSEQILHPERYPKDVPLMLAAPDLEDTMAQSWELRQTTVLGEWRTRQTLQSYLPTEEAAKASANWGGDILETYHNTLLDADMLILITRWDNLRQAQDFALAFREYGTARFGERHPTARGDTWAWDGGYALLERASDQTLWILAPDKATAESARAGLVFPVTSP